MTLMGNFRVIFSCALKNLLRKLVYSRRKEIIEMLFYLQKHNPDKNVRVAHQREQR